MNEQSEKHIAMPSAFLPFLHPNLGGFGDERAEHSAVGDITVNLHHGGAAALLRRQDQ